jgi:O-acetyl-ADP-ribose deacetylase (regulator of RNase III)
MNKTRILVLDGDITMIKADAIITAVNSGGMWFGGIDYAIRRAAGRHFHELLAVKARRMPLRDLDVHAIYGLTKCEDRFSNVIFVVDDLKSPLEKVILAGLSEANAQGFKSVLLPAIRMGVMLGAVEKTPEEAIQEMVKGVEEFLAKQGKETSLEEITFVIYNDPALSQKLRKAFSSLS